MSKLKLKVAKSGRVNPQTKQKGFSPRVLTNGTADFDEIVKEAGHNTTMHKAELRMAFELCLDSVAEMLKQGFIVDLGPIGKLYPSCTGGWYEKEEDMKLSDVKPTLYYRASDDVEAAVHSAMLVWAKAGEDDEETPEGGNSSDNGNNNGGNESGGDNGGGTGEGGSGDNGGGGGDNTPGGDE
jgi:uncharacterized membrane protein YgcG